MKHPVVVLVTVAGDGFTRFSCLECDAPAQPQTKRGVRYWRHYQRAAWRPR